MASKKTGAAKKGGTKSKKDVPTSGQSAPPITLSIGRLNNKERVVLFELNGAGSGIRQTMTIAELAHSCFNDEDPKRANSWTRNSLRRLVQSGLVEKVERGNYRVSLSARKKLARAA